MLMFLKTKTNGDKRMYRTGVDVVITHKRSVLVVSMVTVLKVTISNTRVPPNKK